MTTRKKAVIFGGTGQMGTYLHKLLTDKDYHVISFGSHNCDFRRELGNLNRHFQDILEGEEPDEIYNFASQMHAESSWDAPMRYLLVNGVAVQALLGNIRVFAPHVKLFNAGSADMFDKGTVMQYEDTRLRPSSPHALSKQLAFEVVRLYRDSQKLFAVTGIFFNAESPKRAKTFFAQKVISEAARIKRELEQSNGFRPIQLGRLDARRDWGWAPEYVEVAWKMLQRDKPEDLVIGTGEEHTLKEFVEEVLIQVGLPYVETRFDEYVLYDRTAVDFNKDTMSARPFRAERVLGWKAQYRMKDVVRMLVEAEMAIGQSATAG
jgi:GDPmannose 4,6-dehydratase